MDRTGNHKSKITSTMLASFSSRDSNTLNGLSDPQLLPNNDLVQEFANSTFTPVLGSQTSQNKSNEQIVRSPGSAAYLELIKRKLEPKQPRVSPSSAYGMRKSNVKHVIGEEEFEDEGQGTERIIST